MKTGDKKKWERHLSERLSQSGLRFTSQRQQVYEVLRDRLDHPSAEQVFLRAKNRMPDISMATVYNCLDTLVKCGLVTEVNLERSATRYCPNMDRHFHFHCDHCGEVYDVEPAMEGRSPGFELPPGFRVSQVNMTLRGACAKCGTEKDSLT